MKFIKFNSHIVDMEKSAVGGTTSCKLVVVALNENGEIWVKNGTEPWEPLIRVKSI